MPLVQLFDEGECPALHLVGNAGRIREDQDRIAAFAEWTPLINRGRKATAVKGCAAAESAGGVEHNETRQIFCFAAEAVENPRAEAWPAKLGRHGLHQDLTR